MNYDLKDIYEKYQEGSLYRAAVKHLQEMQNINSNNVSDADKHILFAHAGIAGIGYGKSALEKEKVERIINKQWTQLQKLLKAIKDSNDTTIEKKMEALAEFLKEEKGNALNLLTRRMVITMRPTELFGILNIDDLKILYDQLPKLGIVKAFEWKTEKTDKQWYDNNKALYQTVKSQLIKSGINVDEYILCCMGWYLKQVLLNNLKLQTLLKNNHNLVLTGAPGTGKTYMAKKLAEQIIMDKDVPGEKIKHYYQLVQFHPSYDYTDFVEGLRPTQDDKGNISFQRKDGEFKTFCHGALKEPEKDFVFIIDEINRGELSKIFGELFFAIDPGYRGDKEKVKTQYQNLITEDTDPFKEGFYVPKNVYIIGTMNDIDRSVESMDFAIRRRFAWYEVTWDATFDNILASVLANGLKDNNLTKNIRSHFEKLNELIAKELGTEFCIGGSYLCKLMNYQDKDEPIRCLWEYHIKEVIKEYLRGNPELDIKTFEKAFIYG